MTPLSGLGTYHYMNSIELHKKPSRMRLKLPFRHEVFKVNWHVRFALTCWPTQWPQKNVYTGNLASIQDLSTQQIPESFSWKLFAEKSRQNERSSAQFSLNVNKVSRDFFNFQVLRRMYRNSVKVWKQGMSNLSQKARIEKIAPARSQLWSTCGENLPQQRRIRSSPRKYFGLHQSKSQPKLHHFHQGWH